MKAGKPDKLIVKNKRLDGRKLDEMRPIELQVGNLKIAQGSGLFKFEHTYAQAGVYGPRELHPRFMQNSQKAILRCKYTMVPFSTKERIRPGRSRRSTEISTVIASAFSNVVFFSDFPKTVIDFTSRCIYKMCWIKCSIISISRCWSSNERSCKFLFCW